MKSSIFFTLALLMTTVCLAEVKIEYRISKMHGLMNFVSAITDQPHSSEALKEIFVRSQFNTKQNQEVLAGIDALKESLSKSFDFQTSAPGRHSGVSVANLILIQSFYASDLSDLKKRSLGLMPIADQMQFFTILQKFEPIYDELIWKKYSKSLGHHKKKLEQLAKKINLQKLFTKAEVFYHANWPKDVSFLIGLFPIPYLKNFKNGTTSQSLGSVEEHGVLVGIDDGVNDSFGVIFHELCHSLYESQSQDFMKEFANYFLENKMPERFQAYDWINETLATATGNGWAYEIANGKNDVKSWYNDPIIDGFSKEIYQETKNYLDHDLPIDRKYVDNAILSYSKRFPDSAYAFNNILSRITFIYSDAAFTTAKSESLFKKSFNIFNFNGSSPISHELTVESINQDRATVIIVFHDNEFSGIERLAQHFTIIKNNLDIISKMKNRSYFSALDDTVRPFVFLKIETENELQLALDKMKAVVKMDPKNPVQSF